jgi:hypothetical protein
VSVTLSDRFPWKVIRAAQVMAPLRNAELTAAERHVERLREGRPETLEMTSLQLDSHICSVTYQAPRGP